MSEVLPIPYFHTVLTLPHELNPLLRANQKEMYGCLFRAVSATLQAFSADPKYLGGELGITMVLHTWGKKLNYHVHIHAVVTGGGLNGDQTQWIHAPNEKFLFPVKALSKVFRGKYLDAVSRLVANGKIYEDQAHNRPLSAAGWRKKLDGCGKPWVVYAKRPFGGPRQVIKYLGAYTHRVGISNNRLVSFKNGLVRFTYKDYRRDGQTRLMNLPPEIFVCRFLDHVLPRGFTRIRYSGFMANCKKRKSLKACRKILGETPREEVLAETEEVMEETLDSPVEEARKCPACGALQFVPVALLLVEEVEANRQTWLDSS